MLLLLLFFFFFAILSPTLCSVVWNGNFNDYTINTDFDKWSFSNPVGEYQTYIYGNLNSSFKMSSYVQLSPNFKNPSDIVSNQGIRVEINPTSHWNGQPMLRTELIGLFTEATVETGLIYYKWSMMQGTTNPLNSLNEHQLVFFEAHFADIKYGGSGGTNLYFVTNGQTTWSQPFTAQVWHNLALQVDYNAKTAGLWYSQGANALQQVVAPVGVSTSVSDWHIGSLRLPVNNLQTPDYEWIYYSGVQIVNSAQDLGPGVTVNPQTSASSTNAASTPGGTTAPHTSSTPAGTTAPHTSSTPAGTTAPHPSSTPGGTTAPHTSSTPAGTTAPHTSSTPVGTTTPNAASTPGANSVQQTSFFINTGSSIPVTSGSDLGQVFRLWVLCTLIISLLY